MILEKLKKVHKSQSGVKSKSLSPYIIIVISNNLDLIERIQNYFSAYSVDVIKYNDNLEAIENLFNLYFKSNVYVISDELTLRDNGGVEKFIEVTKGRVGTLLYGEKDDLDYYWAIKSSGIGEYTSLSDKTNQVFNVILYFFGIAKSSSSHWFMISDTTPSHGSQILQHLYKNLHLYVKERPSLNTLFINLDMYSISLDARIGKKVDSKIINSLVNDESLDIKAAQEYIVKIEENLSYFSIDLLHHTNLNSINKISDKLMKFFDLFDGDYSYIFIYVPFYMSKLDVYHQLISRSDNVTLVTDASLDSVYMLKYITEQEGKSLNTNIKTFRCDVNDEERYLLDEGNIYKKTGQKISYTFNLNNKKSLFKKGKSRDDIIYRLIKND